MKIVQITPDFPPLGGGIGSYVFYLSRELQERGHDVSVIFRGRSNSAYDYEGIRVRELRIPGRPPFNTPFFRVELILLNDLLFISIKTFF